jgi:hypothetical protein
VAISDNSLKLLDIIVKGVFGTLVTVLVTFYGVQMQRHSEAQSLAQQQTQAQLNFNQQRAQEIVSLETQQKDLDVKVAEDMLQSLMTSYFQSSTKALSGDEFRRRLLQLQLVALNFQDVPVQLRPLFEDMDRQLTREQDRNALRQIAIDVAGRQSFRLTLGGIFNSGPITVKKGAAIRIAALDSTTVVTIDAVTPDYVSAEISSGLALAGTVGPFQVGYFDWPITDNTKLQNYRLSVTLLQGGSQQAIIRIIVFDSDLAPDRFDIKELGKNLRQKDYSSQ